LNLYRVVGPVADSLTEIVGSTERHIDRGSPFNLTCLVSNYPLHLAYILWYHNSQVRSSQGFFSKALCILTLIFPHTNTSLTVMFAFPAISMFLSMLP
jgi:hypothetical protein